MTDRSGRFGRAVAAALAGGVLAALLMGCDDGADVADGPHPTEATPTPVTTPTGSSARPPTGPGTEQPAGEDVDELIRCHDDEGFALSHPASWHTSSAGGSPGCSQLHPEPFEPPGATDERTAAITAFIDPVPFREVTSPRPERGADRAVTTVDGLQAVRLEHTATQDHLYPGGTEITMYVVDLSPGIDEGPGTLFLDTIDLPGFDYDRNQQVLDRMARTVDITHEAVTTAPAVVARYEGGGGAFSVEGDISDDEACLRIPPGGEPACTDVPGPHEVTIVPLSDLQPILAGIAGAEVFAVTAERDDGTTSTFLPAPIGDTGVAGFAFTLGPEEVDQLVGSDIEGAELIRLQPGR